VTDDKLTPTRRLWIGAFAVAMGGIGFWGGRTLLGPSRAVRQPIQFNHRLHVEEVGLECTTCHLYVEVGAHSGLPAVEVCMQCHEGGLTESPEEAKLLALAASGSTQVFRKLFRLPDHVYYSHRQHVGIVGLKCETCHGGIARTTVPPQTPLVHIDMQVCVGCHAEQGARTDCTPCHR